MSLGNLLLGGCLKLSCMGQLQATVQNTGLGGVPAQRQGRWGIFPPVPEGLRLMAAFLSTSGLPRGGHWGGAQLLEVGGARGRALSAGMQRVAVGNQLEHHERPMDRAVSVSIYTCYT